MKALCKSMWFCLSNNGVYFVSTDPPMLRLSCSETERKKRRKNVEERFGEVIEFAHDCFSVPTTSQEWDKQDRDVIYGFGFKPERVSADTAGLLEQDTVAQEKVTFTQSFVRLTPLSSKRVEAPINLYKSGLQKVC